jgi:hypothetical protein
MSDRLDHLGRRDRRESLVQRAVVLQSQVDASWMVIRTRERLGLVWNVQVPTPERIARRLA